jgi:hypothetical protein
MSQYSELFLCFFIVICFFIIHCIYFKNKSLCVVSKCTDSIYVELINLITFFLYITIFVYIFDMSFKLNKNIITLKQNKDIMKTLSAMSIILFIYIYEYSV